LLIQSALLVVLLAAMKKPQECRETWRSRPADVGTSKNRHRLCSTTLEGTEKGLKEVGCLGETTTDVISWMAEAVLWRSLFSSLRNCEPK